MALFDEKKVRELFDAMDANKDGQVTEDEMLTFLFSTGMSSDEELMGFGMLFAMADKNKSGSVDWQEFKAGMTLVTKVAVGDVDAKAKLLWESCPKKDKNKMTKAELESALKDLIKAAGEKPTKKILDDVIKKADKNGDGMITFKEFKLFCAKDMDSL